MDERERVSLFIDRLEAKRRGLGMDHRRFAEHIGRSEGYWSLLRREKKRVTLDFAQSVIARWPEFSGYWAADLASHSQSGKGREVKANAQ